MKSHLYQIHEDDLASLENNLALIMREGCRDELWETRPDLREAWVMVKETLSNVRFDYGPPKSVERIDP